MSYGDTVFSLSPRSSVVLNPVPTVFSPLSRVWTSSSVEDGSETEVDREGRVGRAEEKIGSVCCLKTKACAALSAAGLSLLTQAVLFSDQSLSVALAQRLTGQHLPRFHS